MADPGTGERKIGGYLLERKVREGPHLQVFESTDNFGRRVEVFCFDGDSLEGRASKDDFFEAVRETAAVAHESSCLMLEMGAEEDLWFVVFLAPEAPSLRTLIDRGGGLAEERVRIVAGGAAAALGKFHAAGLRHGDLRPETVYLSQGEVYLGPRRLVPATLPELDPRYLAPEELAEKKGDLRSDLFVLGLILREAISGEAAVDAPTADAALDRIRAGMKPPPADCSPELAGLLHALSAVDPDDRPSDPDVVSRVLAGEISLSAPPPAPAPADDLFALPEALEAFPAAPAAPTAPPATLPRPPRAVVRSAHGRLTVPLSRDKGDATWDLGADPAFLGLGIDGFPEIRVEERELSVAWIERTPEGYVVQALSGRTPHLRVNGSLVDQHPLADGDRLQLGERTARFEEIAAPLRPAGAPRTRVRRTGDLLVAGATVILCLAVIVQAALRWGGIAAEGQDEIDEAREVAERVEALETAGRSVPDPGGDPLPPDDTGGADTRERRLAAQRESELASAFRELKDDTDGLVEEGSLYDAHILFKNFAEDHPDTRQADRAAASATGLRELLKLRHAEDMAHRERAMEARDFATVQQILDQIEIYGTPRMRAEARELRRDLQQRMNETQISESGEPPPGTGPDGPDDPPVEPEFPPDPGTGDGDAKAEEKAERTFTSASKAVLRQRWLEAVRHLERLTSPPLRGTKFYAGHEAEIERMLGLSKLERDGFAALFNGEVKMGPGRRIAVTYTFKTAAEEEDWTFFNPFADPRSGRFEHIGNTMKGRGVGALVHSAVFEPGTLSVEARIQAIVPHDLGIIFFEPKELIRYYLFSVQNRYFTIGARRAKLEENVIWIFGGGAWADTPDAEIGFVRVAKSKTPEVTAEEWMDIRGAKEGEKVTFAIKRTPPLTGSARGDDRYEFPALRPGLYMLGSEMVLDQVVIRGTLDEGWAKGAFKRARERFQ